MKSYVKRDSTTIKGNIVISTVDQLSLLGDVGSNIKNEVNLQEIDNNKWYPREIRGKIHQKVIERFGEKALYYLGLAEVCRELNAEAYTAQSNRFIKIS